MTNKQKSRLVETINKSLQEAERMFKTQKESHAFIIGWLQGALKIVRDELEEGTDEIDLSKVKCPNAYTDDIFNYGSESEK
jgi:hypothetical protein